MFGEGNENNLRVGKLPRGSGVVARSIFEIFQVETQKNSTIYLSFLQIYNEKVFDLLGSSGETTALRIRENKIYGIFVEGLAEFVVQQESDCFGLLDRGNAMKAIRQTRFNVQSSRSHTVMQIQMESNKANKRGNLKSSKLSLCDLAGSEKFDKEGSISPSHLKELTQINKSLTTLGKVIQELGKKKSSHIPYRDSKLTRLLQDSLGKSAKTVLIATISQSSDFIEETINTLKFADRARMVMLRTKKNEYSAVSHEIVNKLQKEIAHLKALVEIRNKGGIQELQQKIASLTEENKVLKRRATLITVENVEVLRLENKRLRLELQNMGIVQNNGDNFKDSFVSSKSIGRREGHSPREGEKGMSSEVKVVKSLESSEIIKNLQNSPMYQIRKGVESSKSSIANPKPINIRTKLKNSQVFSQQLIRFSKEKQGSNSLKEYQLAKTRLQRIAELEKSTKLKFQAELEKLQIQKKSEKKSLKKLFDSNTLSLHDLYNKRKAHQTSSNLID